MHVGGLFLFEIPENAHLRHSCMILFKISVNRRVFRFIHFNNQLTGIILGWRIWIRYRSSFPSYRVYQIQAYSYELLVYISQQHSSLIDRAKPLWTCDIIEGIEGNRFAMYLNSPCDGGWCCRNAIDRKITLQRPKRKACRTIMVCRREAEELNA